MLFLTSLVLVTILVLYSRVAMAALVFINRPGPPGVGEQGLGGGGAFFDFFDFFDFLDLGLFGCTGGLMLG